MTVVTTVVRRERGPVTSDLGVAGFFAWWRGGLALSPDMLVGERGFVSHNRN
ncbi:MAG: hypothetical protein M3198_10145 [Actinomycetota bacterium]|nr:hypothetical protein [Actinomycetota bacterium]